MEEIAAEKHRLSAVAGTLTACFNSPRLDTPPEVGQVEHMQSSTLSLKISLIEKGSPNSGVRFHFSL